MSASHPNTPVTMVTLMTHYGEAWLVHQGRSILSFQFGTAEEAWRAAKLSGPPIQQTETYDETFYEPLLQALQVGSSFAPFELSPLGTPFQKNVWSILGYIPRGRTISYKTLAEQYGNPKAMRAVASACGANPIAILIPCHRVIGSQGKLTGFRWGLDLKKRLLEEEQYAQELCSI